MNTSPRLKRSTPEEQGISSRAILEWVREIDKLEYPHGFMLMRHGYVIAEGWWEPYNAQTRHQLYSLSKSFTSIAVGLACDEGRMSLDDCVADYFPDKIPDEMDERYRRMTVRHLLTMTAGHESCAMGWMRHAPAGDWAKAFFASPLKYEPGERFAYNSGATYMLSAILNRVTGKSLVDYLNPRLLWPLGIENGYWDTCPWGIQVGGWGFHLCTPEIANFAQMLLDGGKWEGRQLVPADYIKQATAFQSDNSMNENPDWKLGYGFQFWRSQHNSYRADGAAGQYALVMPDHDMALAFNAGMGGMQEVLTQVWEKLLPQAKAEALPADPEGEKELQTFIAHMHLPLAEGHKPATTRHAITEYEIEPNEAGVKRVGLSWTGAECEMAFTIWGKTETLRAGFGHNIDGTFSLYYPNQHTGTCKVSASAGWKNANELAVKIWFYENPFVMDLTLKIYGDELTLESSTNLEFNMVRRIYWPVLKGKSK